jgi:hypothetical protein
MTMLINTTADFRRAARVGPYAWPSGYDTFFLTTDNATLCYACAMRERTSVIWSIAHRVNDGWQVVAFDAVCNADGPLMCDHCGLVILPDDDAPALLDLSDDRACDQCAMLTIKGVTCHDLRCPNFRSRWDAETGTWIKQRTCAECGYAYDADEMCEMCSDGDDRLRE